MKCFCAILESIPARVSWIEINYHSSLNPSDLCRYLRGYRGLKYCSVGTVYLTPASIPARVSWIEIILSSHLIILIDVDTCEGIVD